MTQVTDSSVGPFSDLILQVKGALLNAVLPSAPSSFWWPLLLLTLAIAVYFWISRNGRGAKGANGQERPMGFWEYLFPREIYTHQSARVDIGLYLLDRGLMPIWVITFLGATAPFIEQHTVAGLSFLFGSSPELDMTIAWRFTYAAVTLLIADMIFFFTHLMMHKTRIGWAIHKVHHSAQVLTPLTRSREHFIAAPIWALGPAIGLSFAGGIFAYLFKEPITSITIMNISIFSLLYALNGNFRHYHISFRYPRWLEYWLQSPGMHHTHHSYLEKHWDSNLGLVTSVWDRLFGTLYIADKYEETPWGLNQQDQKDHTSLKGNLVTPFREIARILRRK
ncbi:MAG: sterol desaturase/sphingolipid hydroxylase (fatty acid hydroxylase superfamily) [Cryomorphaceae bacterium]|jgi:sterol desaturase/sphingolipid hydroxylase (fatty acid hydroxylase superfamily)